MFKVFPRQVFFVIKYKKLDTLKLYMYNILKETLGGGSHDPVSLTASLASKTKSSFSNQQIGLNVLHLH